MVDLALSWQEAGMSAACLAVAAAGARRSRRAALVTASGFAMETAVVLALFGMWQLAGSFVLMGPEGAVDRGQWIWRLERAVHLPSETAVQLAFLPHPLMVQALNLYYAGLHFVVVIGCLIWVYVWHRRQYPRVRTTLVLFTAAALLVQFIPVAPPRMLPGDGMIDTALRYGQSVYGSVAGFNADQLSAMPSVHVGWSLLAALVIVEVSRSRWRWLALAYPVLTMLAVVVTANHYWLDGIAAALLLALALVVQRLSRTLYVRFGPMAGHLTARPHLAQRRDLGRTAVDGQRAARVKYAAGWGTGRIGRLTRQHQPGPPGGHVDLGHRRAQGLRVRVGRDAEQLGGRAALHHPPQVQHRRLLAQLGYDAEVVGDQQVGQVPAGAQIGDLAQDPGLRLHVDGAGWLVQHQQPGLDAQRPRDGDPLPLPA